MNITDYLIIGLVVVSALVGIFRGFMREVVAVLTWIVAFFAAWYFADLVEPHLGGLLAQASVRTWAARTIIFVGVLFLGAAVGAVIGHFVRVSIFSGLDRFLGFLFGLLRAVLVLGVFVILAQQLRLDGEAWWRRSILIPYAEGIGSALRAMVGEAAHT